jgi:hypothetical protein
MKTSYYLLQRFLFLMPLHKLKARRANIIYKPDAIGDFVLATQAIQQWIQTTNEPWILICSRVNVELALKLFPDIEVISFQGPKRLWKIFRFCLGICCVRLICLKHSQTGMDHVIFKWLRPQESFGVIGSPIPIATPSSFMKFSFTVSIPYPTVRKYYPLELEAHHQLLASVVAEPLPIWPNLSPLSMTPRVPPVLTIFPVTQSTLRNYPASKLAKAVSDFAKIYPNCQFKISGASHEKASLSEFAKLLPSELNAQLTLPLDLIGAISLIASSSLVLSMESAPAHLAVALDVPGVFILGGGHFNFFAPWGNPEKHIWLSHPLDCYSCNWNCIHPEAFCVANIPSMELTQNLESLFKSLPITL